MTAPSEGAGTIHSALADAPPVQAPDHRPPSRGPQDSGIAKDETELSLADHLPGSQPRPDTNAARVRIDVPIGQAPTAIGYSHLCSGESRAAVGRFGVRPHLRLTNPLPPSTLCSLRRADAELAILHRSAKAQPATSNGALIGVRRGPGSPGQHTWSRSVMGLGSGEFPAPVRH